MTKTTQTVDKISKKRKRGLACKNCRKRKVKCNINEKYPCTSCLSSNQECIESTIDKRKERAESEYTQHLENRLSVYQEENARIASQLENIVKVMREVMDVSSSFEFNKLKNETTNTGISSPQTNYINNYTNIQYIQDDIEPNLEEDVESSENLNEKYPTPSTFKAFDNKPLSVYGATSVFDNISVSKLKNLKEMEEIYILNRDPKINFYIKLFFQWQYPDIHIFVFREAFLLDFLHAKNNSSYCSTELIFSICAFGCLLSEDEDKKQISNNFNEKAKQLCFNNYSKPSISLLQSFLLLGLYDIYNGKNDSGWILSGMGMRMGYSIGLQLNSREDIDNLKSELGTKIRSRIFWGTYLVDHLIGLLLGRPPSLKMNDSTIEETIELPDIDWIHEYTCPGELGEATKILLIGNPLCEMVKLMNISGDMINDIFNDQKYSKQNDSVIFYRRLPLVRKYNLSMFKWRKTLPESLLWNSSDLKEIGADPTTLTFKLIYYIVILCLNRPFLNSKVNEQYVEYCANCRKICLNAVNDLTIALSRFTTIYGFDKCSNLIIYSCIISISVILRSYNSDSKSNLMSDPEVKFKILLFMKILRECSRNWGLSEKAFKLTKDKLRKEHNINIEEELNSFDQNEQPDLFTSDYTEEFIISGHESVDGEKDYSCSPLDKEQMLQSKDSLGGPPIFMLSNTFSLLDEFLSDDMIDPFDFEV